MYACKIFLCARISTHRESERLMLFEPSLLPAYQIIPRRRDEIYIHIFRIFHFTLAVNLVEKIKKKKKKETSVINELFARSIHFFQSITTIFIVSRHVICPWPIPFLTTRLIFSSIIFFFFCLKLFLILKIICIYLGISRIWFIWPSTNFYLILTLLHLKREKNQIYPVNLSTN